MKAKLNNLIARYEKDIARLKADFNISDMQYTQLCMLQGFLHELKTLREPTTAKVVRSSSAAPTPPQ